MSLLSTGRKIWAMLTPPERRQGLAVAILMVIGMALETLGVGLFLPALAVLTTTDFAGAYPSMVPFLEAIGNPGQEALVALAMSVLLCVYAAKAAVLGFVAWRQSRFSYTVQVRLSRQLLLGYLRQPYTFHLQRNSAQLIRTALSSADKVTEFGLVAGQLFLSECMALLGICALLFVVEPVGAAVAMALLIGAG